MSLINGLHLSLGAPIVNDLPLPKYPQIFHVTPMCWVHQELNPLGSLLVMLIELPQQVEPEFYEEFQWSKLADWQKP